MGYTDTLVLGLLAHAVGGLDITHHVLVAEGIMVEPAMRLRIEIIAARTGIEAVARRIAHADLAIAAIGIAVLDDVVRVAGPLDAVGGSRGGEASQHQK